MVAGFKGDIIPNYSYEVALNTSNEALTFQNSQPDPRSPNSTRPSRAATTRAGNPATGGTYSKVDGHLQPALDFFSRSPSEASLAGIFGTDIRHFGDEV